MFGIGKREIKQGLAVVLTFVLLLASTPISGFATDMANMLRGMGGAATVSGGDVSGGDVSGSDVSSGDFVVNVTGPGKVEVVQDGTTIGEVEGTTSERITTQLGEVNVSFNPDDAGNAGERNYVASAANEAGDLQFDRLQGADYSFEVEEGSLDHSLDVVFGTEYLYQFTVNGADGLDKLTLKNSGEIDYTFEDDNTSLWVDSEEIPLTLSVEPKAGYGIKAITIDGVVVNDLPDLGEDYTKSGIAVDATAIEVTLVQLYKVTVVANQYGVITIDGTNVGNFYVAERDGNKFVFVATPGGTSDKDYYRVASVKINGEIQTDCVGNNGGVYMRELDKDADYTFEIVFALNQYEVVTNDFSNEVSLTWANQVDGNDASGTLSADTEYMLDYGTVISGVITPDAGRKIAGVTFAGQEVALTKSATDSKVTFEVTVSEAAFGELTILLEDIVAEPDDVTVDENMVGQNKLEATYYTATFSNDALLVGEKNSVPFIVLPKGTTVTFEPKTVVNGSESVAYGRIRLNGAGEVAEEVVLTETTAITSVFVSVDDNLSGGVYAVACNYLIVIDEDAPEVTLTPVKNNGEYVNASGVDYYNNDVTINVTIDDGENSAGIKTVSYTVDGVAKGNVTGAQDTAVGTWSGSLTVPKVTNADGIEVVVTVVDEAGNTSEATYTFNLDADKPEVAINFVQDQAKATEDGVKYYIGNREATVSFTERSFTTDGVTITVKRTTYNDAGQPVVEQIVISGADVTWTTDPTDNTIHNATVIFTEEGIYEWTVACVDVAGNTSEIIEGEKFAIDLNKPTGQILINNNPIAAGPYRGEIRVSSVSRDAVSSIKEVKYCVVYGDAPQNGITETELANLTWTAEMPVIDSSEKFVVYVKIVDLVDKVNYLASAGTIVLDTLAPTINAVSPGTSTNFDGKGLSNGDVTVTVNVSDPVPENGVSSGIQTVSYVVYNGGAASEQGTVNGSSFTVSAGRNNSNDVKVVVTATDKAGNTTSKTSSTFAIDTTAPTIRVSYDNNTPDSGNYYKAARTATIVITERNFDPEKVAINITNTDGIIPTLSGWTSSGSGDGTTHVATITYAADGDYTFGISVTDAAGNVSNGVTYAEGTVNETAFTIDTSVPAIRIDYDNDDVRNNTFFAGTRTATVTVTEHNFDVNRVAVTISASLDGQKITTPEIQWASNGDIHRGTIKYTADGDYTFDISMTDMAGNTNSDVTYACEAGQVFTVDTKAPKCDIAGVEDGKALEGEEFSVTYGDINLAKAEIHLYRTKNAEKEAEVTADFVKETVNAEGDTVRTFTIPSDTQDNDGIYTLKITMIDSAENVTYENHEIKFTVNNYGSVYEFDEYLSQLVTGMYTQNVEKALVITEINPNKLKDNSWKVEITKDGTPVSGVSVTPQMVLDETVSWYQYVYTIDASYFAADGIYRIAISSEDEANNKPETMNYADKTIVFYVDTQAPEISSILGLEEDIVNGTDKDVTFGVFDAIALKQVTVYVNGQATVYNQFDDLNNYSDTFKVLEGTNQTVRIEVEDMAGNKIDTESETFAPAFAFNNTITVSTNFWIRFMANKPLFFGSIAGVVAVAGGSAAAVVLKRRKKVSKRK